MGECTPPLWTFLIPDFFQDRCENDFSNVIKIILRVYNVKFLFCGQLEVRFRGTQKEECTPPLILEYFVKCNGHSKRLSTLHGLDTLYLLGTQYDHFLLKNEKSIKYSFTFVRKCLEVCRNSQLTLSLTNWIVCYNIQRLEYNHFFSDYYVLFFQIVPSQYLICLE